MVNVQSCFSNSHPSQKWHLIVWLVEWWRRGHGNLGSANALLRNSEVELCYKPQMYVSNDLNCFVHSHAYRWLWCLFCLNNHIC